MSVNGGGLEFPFEEHETVFVDLSSYRHAASVVVKASYVEPTPEGIALGMPPRIPALVYEFKGPDGESLGEFFLPLEEPIMDRWGTTHSRAVIAALAAAGQG